MARLKLLRELAVTFDVDVALPRVAPSYGVAPCVPWSFGQCG
jgi:arginase family enzyme